MSWLLMYVRLPRVTVDINHVIASHTSDRNPTFPFLSYLPSSSFKAFAVPFFLLHTYPTLECIIEISVCVSGAPLRDDIIDTDEQ